MKLGRFSQVLIIIFIISLFGFGNFGEVGAQQQVSNPVSQDAFSGTVNTAVDAIAKIGPVDNVMYIVFKIVTVIQRSITGVALGIAGSIFDFVMQFTVRDIRSSFGLFETHITELWKIFRDIGNIIIIFSLLYLAIRTIIDGNGFADRKTLARILIAAIFINFSLFFTKIVFDTSNRVAIEIYNGIDGSGNVDSQGVWFVAEVASSFGLVNNDQSAWQQVGSALSTAGGFLPFIGNSNALDDIVSEIFSGLMISVLSVVAAIIFLIGAIMLVFRFLAFVLLMAISPIGMVGSLIPYLSNYLGFWWRNLWKHAVALPVFMLMFYIAYTFIRGPFSSEINAAHVNILSSDPSLFTAALRMNMFYIMSMILLGLTIFLPMKIGDRASSAAIRSSKAVGRFGANVLARGTAFAGRNSVGAAGRYVGNLAKNNESLSRITGATLKKDFSNWGEVVAGASLQKVIRAGNEIGNKKTYDPRNIKVGGKTLGQRFGLGKGVENYETIIKLKQKELEEKGKKDAELFGWDKKTDKEKETISNMKSDKNVLEQELKDLIKELKDIKAGKTVRDSAGNVKTLDSVRAERISKQKEIDKLSIDIGELEEKGMSMFLNRQKTFMSVLSKAVKLDIESIKAVAKIDKARKKKWTAGNEKRFEQMLNKALKS